MRLAGEKDRTESIWESVELPVYTALDRNIDTEVCVIGGGITGVSMAYQLAKRGHRVVLLEAFRMGSGQTGRTTAHLSNQLEEEFVELLKKHSRETVTLFREAHRLAIETVEHIVGLENIACDFRRLDGYLFQGRNVKESFLFEERDAARECGLLLDHVDATPFLKKRVPGLKFSGQAQFHPIKYLRGLLGVLKDLEVKVFEETHVSGLHNPSPEQTVVSTATGFQVRARHVVVATDSPINTRFHIHSKKFAYRTYAMAFRYSAPLEGNEVLLWDTEDPYHYVRFHEDQIIVGAEDHRTGQQPARDPFENLEKWTRGNFEHVGELCWKWSGQVFEPADQLPYIGVSPGSEKNIYVATGFSGIGLTHGTIASLLIPDLIEGKENPWAAHFDPSRPPLRSLSHFVLENMNVAYQYTDYISPAEVKDLDDIPEDTGCLMREGLTKACVYHEEGENFERRSAVCPHLGGIVHWNDIEKTWDCPAHGSRFNTRGKVIEGPSISGLADL